MGEGKGGGECPNRVPPHLYPLPPRGEEVFCGVIFLDFFEVAPCALRFTFLRTRNTATETFFSETFLKLLYALCSMLYAVFCFLGEVTYAV